MGKKKNIEASDIGLKAAAGHADAKSPETKEPTKIAAYWDKELQQARKREKSWRREAEKIVELYEAEKKGDVPFNILYANTETMLPVLFSERPRPVVKRRQRSNNDPKALMAARVAQRLLEYFIDDGLVDSPSFETLAERSVLQALVPGRGIMRLRYEADIEDSVKDEKTVAVLKSEHIAAEYVEWDRVLFSYARTWKLVTWLAFEHIMTREELIANFGEELGNKVPLTMVTSEEASSSADEDSDRNPPADSEGAHLAQVYEIWDKSQKKVIFYAPEYDKDILKVVPDPLGLAGFFPCAEPLVLMNKISSMLPKPLYAFYKEQAEELNHITRRIMILTKALKIRGFYDNTIKGMEQLLTAEDNKLFPASDVAAFQQGQTLDKAIWLMPIEKIVVVLQQLYLQRDKCKALIYEITGISDIVRGASAASETLGAQQMKQNWVTIRVKRLQKKVTGYLRDNLRIMAEVAVGKLGADTIAQMTGVELPTEEEKLAAQQKLDDFKMQQMQAQATPQPSPGMPAAPQGAPGTAPSAPPAPPAPKPELDPNVVATLNLPTMEEVVALLANDLMRSYTIDIETNSTLDTEATEDKQQVTEFLNAMAQFMSGIAPLMQSGAMPFEAAQSIMLNVARRFRMSDEVEEALMKMKPPKPADDGKGKDIEGQKQLMQVKVQTAQQELDLKKKLAELELQIQREKMQLEREKLQLQRMKAQHDTEMQTHKHQMNLRGLEQEEAVRNAQHNLRMQTAMTPPQAVQQPNTEAAKPAGM